MGQALIRLAGDDPDIVVAAAVSKECMQSVPGGGVPYLRADALSQAPDFDVAIDFSLPEGFPAIVCLCQSRKVPLVSGTTGLDAASLALLHQAAASIPVIWASNFSLGVAVLTELVRDARPLLVNWDCSILETHHTLKKDAPSGTAITLAQAASLQGQAPSIASIRAGDIVGEHVVQITGFGERIELIHRATNRDIFARGALYAAKRLVRRPAGLYEINAMLH